MREADSSLSELVRDEVDTALILRVMDALTLEPDLEHFFQRAAEAARQLVGADGAALILKNETGALEYQFFHGENALRLEGFRGYQFPFESGTVGQALRERRSVLEPDYTNSPHALPDFLSAGLHSNLVVPLFCNDEPLGALALSWFSPMAGEITRTRRQLVQKVGDQLAVASHRHLLERRLREQAIVDELTGLYNRSGILSRLEARLAEYRRHGHAFALILLDLDRFKDINDLHGHAMGDSVLRDCAERMQHVCRRHDDIGRLGGDEFIILASTEDCETLDPLLKRLVTAMSLPLVVGGARPTASIGIARCPQDGDTAESLQIRADLALYEAKSRHGATSHLFEEALETRIIEAEERTQGILQAIEHGRLHLFYQPILPWETSQPTAYEALLRWDHPEEGLLTAGTFMPAVEEAGADLTRQLGHWVLHTALAQIARQFPRPGDPPCIHINVSPCHFTSARFPQELATALERFPDIPPGCVVLEITETALLESFEAAKVTAQACHALGVRLALDDFGSGYASFNYLKQLPVDTLKVDGEFVIELFNDPENDAILRGIATMGRALGLQTVAEGVETPAHVDALRPMGFDRVQGFGIGAPAPLASMRARPDIL
ncbi:MAG: putative bifunctional diguanylate cyclase/phosphodiesterase [Thiohalospira sp.]